MMPLQLDIQSYLLIQVTKIFFGEFSENLHYMHIDIRIYYSRKSIREWC